MNTFNFSICFHHFFCFEGKRVEEVEHVFGGDHNELARRAESCIIDTSDIQSVVLIKFFILEFEELNKFSKQDDDIASQRIHRYSKRLLKK